MIKERIIPVILSGGKGSRLWPLSRESFPKQYLSLDEESEYSLLQNTFLRLENINYIDDPIIVTNEEQRFIVAEQMRALKIKTKSILLEPYARNTCPSVALASLIAKEDCNDPILLVLASDHKIKNNHNFIKAINQGVINALQGRIIVFGVYPTAPETGYGYIESLQVLSEENPVSNVKSFQEKPDLAKAKKFLSNKHFSWNSGIFMFKASTLIKELNTHHPDILNICKDALSGGSKDYDFRRVDIELFKKCPSSSIDVSIMEKTNLATVVRLNCEWSDLGSWKSISENSKFDINKNTLRGKAYIKNVKNSYIRSESRLIACVGIKDLLVIETDDAVLVANKNSTESIKDLVKELSDKNFEESKNSRKIHRPWGNYKSISEGKSWKVKRLEINPGESISLQLHKKRSEHWVVVNGIAKVEINGIISKLCKNQSIYVPLSSKHRLSNPGREVLTLIEVQCGEYLEEDDIVRFDDNYGRITN